MNIRTIGILLGVFCQLLIQTQVNGQGMHFSQYYNAPLLLNPANTALMTENDYRVGLNYRKQWASVPVPFNTTSVFVDFQAMRNRNLTNWLGLGLAFWNDKAGDGQLSLTRTEAFLAYHVQLGQTSMISAGASVAAVQRSVDFNKLTFDRQWDGFLFNTSLPTGEQGYVMKTNFMDLGAGVNYAFFPSESFYLKIGVGVAHINQPKETFYNQENKLGIRPTGNIDLLLQLSPTVILNPSVYYTNDKSASELLLGTLFQVDLSAQEEENLQLILGAHHRLGESVIGTIGFGIEGFRLMSGYDFTVSSLSPSNKGRGAFEIS
ncbi:MAG: type IX secretion system membrane protein PorP/SprF, partial [Sphingobacteriales bacterium]